MHNCVCIHDLALMFLPYIAACPLKSAEEALPFLSQMRGVTVWGQSFCIMASQLWNPSWKTEEYSLTHVFLTRTQNIPISPSIWLLIGYDVLFLWIVCFPGHSCVPHWFNEFPKTCSVSILVFHHVVKNVYC